MAAVAAILALFVVARPYSPTPFVSTLDEKAILTKICSDLDLPLEFGGASIGGFRASNNDGGRESSLMLRAPDQGTFQTYVMPELQKRIEAMLIDLGASIEGRSHGGTEDFKELQQFGFHYRLKGTSGKIRIYSLEQRESQLRLLILIDEW